MAQPKKSRRGLGRGLGALIQNTSEEDTVPEPSQDVSAESDASDETVITDEAPKIDLKAPPETVGSRYLDEAKPLKDRRRPSDLFFGGDVSNPKEPLGPKESSTAKDVARPKASRASMPNPILDRPRVAA